MLLIMCHILNNVKGKSMFLGKIFVTMERARPRLHALMLFTLLLWKFSNYSQEDYHKAKRVRVKLRKKSI